MGPIPAPVAVFADDNFINTLRNFLLSSDGVVNDSGFLVALIKVASKQHRRATIFAAISCWMFKGILENKQSITL
uniref:Uncharacterized protein n=1 Tax=Romanomermis culicivorax TaxID=13658 RepID=A0A915JFG7_ROMCU